MASESAALDESRLGSPFGLRRRRLSAVLSFHDAASSPASTKRKIRTSCICSAAYERFYCGLLIIPLLLLSGVMLGQSRQLTLDDLYHPSQKINFDGSQPIGLQWLSDGDHYLQRVSGDDGPVAKVEARSGARTPFFNVDELEQQFMQTLGFSRERALELSRQSQIEVSPSEDGLLITCEDDLFYFALSSSSLTRLTHGPEAELEATFSPDGQLVAFVRDSDLYVAETSTGEVRRLTRDGSPLVLNGLLDWVYQEEIYGRGNFKGYWWSPDSAAVAFLQIDDRPVPRFPVADYLQTPPAVETSPYPKAGDPNPEARLAIVDLVEERTTWVDLSGYDEDFLIVKVAWSPDSQEVIFQVQDRTQTWLDLNRVRRNDSSVHRLLRETSSAWVNVLEDPVWMDDGSFLWLSDRSGWSHLYHYGADARLIGEITSGEWNILEVYGIDSATSRVYFSANREGILDSHIYSAVIDGSEIVRLTNQAGTHVADFNPQMTLFINEWSDVQTPTRVEIRNSEGEQIRSVSDNEGGILKEFQLVEPEFLTVETEDGFILDTMMLKPSDFDVGQRYPVLIHLYGGPQTALVRNEWKSTSYLWHQYIAQQGYIVWYIDNRSSSGKGAQSSWPIYRNFGRQEMRDLEDAVDWLMSQQYVDPQRIGLWGWSFGGYLSAFALTQSDHFKVGIAGAPLTDWRLYDSIYTERYMGTPQDNPEGYRTSSVIEAAADLTGRLLLIHGMVDDNVHFQNTVRFVHALQKEGKAFDLMVYPESRHSVNDPMKTYHLRKLMTDFILNHL